MPSLDALCASVSPWTPFVEPALLLLWLELCPPATTRHTFTRTGNLAGVSLAVATRGWYAAPDYAGSPVATLGSAALLIVPALLAVATSHQAASQNGEHRLARVMYSLAAGYCVLVSMLVPALLLFVRLGGDTL